MNRGLFVFIGCVLTFASSWLGLVVLPYLQLNAQEPYQASPSAEAYPQPLTANTKQKQALLAVKYPGSALAGAAAINATLLRLPNPVAGRTVYQANGCVYCHSQQVRSQHFANGADIARGWGQRRTVSRDYIYDRPVMLGTMRTGPDLAAVGERIASPSWHHEHLFNPRSKSDWSIMPSFSFLYERRPIDNGERSAEALTLGREWTVTPGRQYRPTDAQWAAALAADGETLKKTYAAANPDKPPLNLDDERSRADLLTFWLATPEEGFEVVPKAEAGDLVAYLLELRKTATPLPEATEP